MKRFKIFMVILVSVVAIIFSIFEPKVVNYSSINSVISIVAILSFVFQFLQKESNFVFINYRKFINLINRDTVVWNSTVSYIFDNCKKIDDIISIIFTIQGISVLESDYKTDRVYLKIKYMGCNHDINIVQDKEYNKLIVEYTTSVSYRDSRNEFRKFKLILDTLEMNTSNISPLMYSVNISFTKAIPVYRYLVRNLEENADIQYKLSFKEEKNTEIHMYNNKLEIISKSKENIEQILKNYIIS